MGRIAYGLLFVVVLPLALVVWAGALGPRVGLPAFVSIPGGTVLLAIAAALMAGGAHDLIAIGGGLPMNAFPPPRFVRSGIYAWLRNPIYVGFVLACAGVALVTGSAAGLWIVTPVVALGSAALVFGYERHDLRRRFGEAALAPTRLSLPSGGGAAGPLDRAAVLLWVLMPWLVAFYAVQGLGRPPDAIGTMLPVERGWPVVQWTEIAYASAYLFIPLTVAIVRTREGLRRFALQGTIGIVVITLAWLTIPVVATNRAFVPVNAAGRLLAFEQAHSHGVAAFPAFHVLWALIAGAAWASNARATGRRWWAWAGWTWAWAITISCLTTSMHTLVEVGAAIALFVPISRYERTWAAIRTGTERIANSWHEWRIGPLRLISHGGWGAAAAGTGLLVAGAAAGGERLGAVLWVSLCVLAGAGIWAQALEGSSKLLRPFGWYGGLLGGVFGALTARILEVPILPLLAAFAVAAPWIQILGRIRCLVQGCCHGGAAPVEIGIRYLHRRSRVTQLADLAGVPVHPTPLYSIVGNFVIGALMLRLRVLQVPDAIIVGAYLILGGAARFVEESFRAEPQTPIVAGLHSYQWIAVASVIAGMACMTLPSSAAATPLAWPAAPILWAALLMAVLAGLALGVDFPGSNRRFSRLAAGD